MTGQTEAFADERGCCGVCGHKLPRTQDTDHQRALTIRQARLWIDQGLPLHWTFRRGDPTSSKLSGLLGQTFRTGVRLRLYIAARTLKRCTAREAAEAARLDYEKSGAWRRWSELAKMRLIVPTGKLVDVPGGHMEVYRCPTP